MPIHRLSDSRLIRRSQQGDRDAFVALVQRYDDRLRGLVYGLVAGREAMDRVLRVAYLKAWRDVVRADPDDDAGTWLYRIVYNACIDELRRERRRIEAPGSSVISAGSATVPDDPLVAALAALPPEERVVTVLVDREGFTPEGAARILGLDPETLTTRLAAARAHLAPVVSTRPRPRPGPGPRRPRPPRPGSRPGPSPTPSLTEDAPGTAKADAGPPTTNPATSARNTTEASGRRAEGAPGSDAETPGPDAARAGGGAAGGGAGGGASAPVADTTHPIAPTRPAPPASAAGPATPAPEPEMPRPIAPDRPSAVPDARAAAPPSTQAPAAAPSPTAPPAGAPAMPSAPGSTSLPPGSLPT